jgi:hypothetical protein
MENTDTTTQRQPKTKWLSIQIGVVGLLCAIIGNLYPETMLQKHLYLAGGVLLFISALREREEYFIALEVVVTICALLAYLPDHGELKMAVPLVLSLFSIAYLYYRGLLRSWLSLVGVTGLVLLGLGYATLNPLIYLAGGIVLTIYSAVSYYRGVGIALLWAILNAVFALTALISFL